MAANARFRHGKSPRSVRLRRAACCVLRRNFELGAWERTFEFCGSATARDDASRRGQDSTGDKDKAAFS